MPQEAMKPEEFVRRMEEIASDSDREGRHIDADNLMCDLLISLGYKEGIEKFIHMHKWHA